jgi:hypothetical protein
MTVKFGRNLSPLPDRETARPWADIEARFADLARSNPRFQALADLSHHLAQSGFATAGLCGSTSMHDLVIGPSAYVFQNPHLRIEYDFDASTFQLVYVDGSLTPWERSAAVDEVASVVDRFLTKRARWYRAG